MINPVNMTLRDWADSVLLSIGDAWSVGRLDNDLEWQTWGIGLLRAFSQRNLPNPYEFDDWRLWAEHVYPMLEVMT